MTLNQPTAPKNLRCEKSSGVYDLPTRVVQGTTVFSQYQSEPEERIYRKCIKSSQNIPLSSLAVFSYYLIIREKCWTLMLRNLFIRYR